MPVKNVHDILNGTIETVRSILPFTITADQPSTFFEPLTNHSFGVLIGLTGNVRGNIIIDGNEDVFKKIGHSMFGMQLEGEMLLSFAGELGNMLAGKLSTTITGDGGEMDITPPTVLIEKTLVNCFDQAYKLPFFIDTVGSLLIFFMIEK